MTTNTTSESESDTRKAGSLASVDFDVFGSDASAEETAASEAIDFDLSADTTHEAALSEPTAAAGELDFDLFGEAGKAGELAHHGASGLRRRTRLERRKPTTRSPFWSRPCVVQVTMPFFGSLPEMRVSVVTLCEVMVSPG